MQLSAFTFLLALAAEGVNAGLHNAAVCVENVKVTHKGGYPWKLSYDWNETYEINTAATQCACNYYLHRNTGNHQWDKCPDCTFDGTACNSAGWHIGGDEMNYYCTQKCGAQGSEAN
ncbi:hypothetical protein EDB80DRAFT_684019 [Ilyonectria destructans]|nr:hypothetical protein EDB80DRAFT_684019 [Ilyonectria destructans]